MLNVGKIEIPYHVRFSEKAKYRRIVVTPGQVEVIVPSGTTEPQIADYIHRKRRWVYDQVQKMKELMAARPAVSKYITGAKIPYRGRNMSLTVTKSPSTSIPKLTYKNGFYVEIPEGLTPQMGDFLVEMEIRFWLKRRIRTDVKEIVSKLGKRHGLVPKTIRVKEQKHLWGSCGKDRIININWMLIFAPKPVLEYAVVHELCHLKHRNHGPDFWALVGEVISDYEIKKHWLDRNESLLGWDSLVRG